ncbi:energy-coupling factor ABC transporter ATP-binding protein [Blastochloris sulfoviridis]|uniref:energy-coupling factor ABC transporter ATP-binding protein n=1 Tax=Blastochloris sulfoviridis TaxID=50712 RepID=UPI001AEDF656|nr:ABC transporter ATP-binding protein [Blastochloris sulfoviridis]
MTVELDRAGVVIDGRTIIAPTTLTLKERRIGVIGANGSGKSTFARLLNGLVVPTTGAVRIDGLDTAREAAKIRRSVGFVFQNPDNQIVFPIIAEDMAFGLKNSGLAKVEIPTRVTAELARLGIAHLVERASHSLSGGEKQLAALAAVLVMRPKLVVFDEPTTLLDLKNRNRIRAVIDALAASALVVTHDLDLVERFDRVLVIEDGRIAADDTPRAAIAWYRERAAA